MSFLRVDREETFLFLSNRRGRETNPELVKGSGTNHYPRAPAPELVKGSGANHYPRATAHFNNIPAFVCLCSWHTRNDKPMLY